MKKTILLLFCSAIAVSVFGQSDVSGFPFGHQRQPGRFCGWSPGLGSVAGSFDIRNDFAGQPINFFAGGSTAAFQRMTILGTNGFVGIGSGFTAPTNLLHIASDANAGYAQITNATTGNLLTDGFQFGIEANGNALIRQMENAPLYLQTNAQNRFKINRSVPYDVNGFSDSRGGYMLLSPIQNPALSGSTGNIFDADRGAFSMLHLHGNGTVPEFGV